MCGAYRLVPVPVGHGEPGLELLADDSRRVTLGDLHPGGDDVAGQGVRAVLLDVGCAATEPPHHLRLAREPEVEVAQQPALADARVPDDVDDEVAPLVDDVEEAFLEEPDLTGPADGARLDALDDAEPVEPESPRTFRDHEVGVDRRVEALELQAGHRMHVERPSDLPVGLGGDEDAAHGSGGLQAGGPVDRRPDRDEVVSGPLAQGADDDLAGVDADAHPRRHSEPALDLVTELGRRGRHGQTRADRSLGVVLVGAVQTEHRHDGVADELLDDPAVRLDGRLPAGEAGGDDGPGVLRVQLPGQDGEVHEVGEQDADQLALLAPLAGDELGPSLTQRRQGGLDHLVAEHRALRLQGRDGALDRGQVAGRGAGARRGRRRRARTHAAYRNSVSAPARRRTSGTRSNPWAYAAGSWCHGPTNPEAPRESVYAGQ